MGVEDKCMKRKILSICCVLCMVLSLAACQETPEEEIVLDKSKGLPKDSILPKESQIPKHNHQTTSENELRTAFC